MRHEGRKVDQVNRVGRIDGLGSGGPAAATPAATAVFSTSNLQLTLPQVRIDNSLRASDVVLTFLDFGQIQVGDPAVGSQIEFLSQSNVLRIPELILDGARFTGVSLTGSAIQLLSLGPIEIDSPVQGSHTLVLYLNVGGQDMGEVSRIVDIPKPANQAEFCDDARMQELRNTITQQSGGAVGTLTLKSCAFDGTRGQVSMELGIQAPYPGLPAMNIPYTATYVYQ